MSDTTISVPTLPPAPENLGRALFAFVHTMAAVASLRGERSGLGWIISASGLLAGVDEMATPIDSVELSPEDEDAATKAAFSVLETEMLYIAFRYRQLLSGDSLNIADSVAERFQGVQPGNPLEDRVVDEIDKVKGSIEQLIKRLPKWLQRVADVLMEMLKLTKGMIH